MTADVPVAMEEVRWRPRRGGFSLGPITARAEKGRFIALIGPNGAGKSTLLNLAGGLLVPDAGRVDVFGKSHDRWSPRERGRVAAFLSQDPERPFGFTVEEYVGLGRFPHAGAFRRLSAADEAVVAAEMDAWGLGALGGRSVRTLSGGEFQRVRLARAFAQEPRLLILDEPGNHLDMAVRGDILRRLSDAAGGGCCVMAVLHDVNDALLHADEAWLMNEGRLLDRGGPGTVLREDRLSEVYGLELEVFSAADGAKMLGFPRRWKRALR